MVLVGGLISRRALAIDGARLVHVAAHGTFRADSPLFSALELHDGPNEGYRAGVGQASVVRVDDPSTLPLMLDLHRHLSRGADLSTAHLLARQAARADPARRLAADSFIALGC